MWLDVLWACLVQLVISCHSVCPCVKEAMLFWRVLIWTKLSLRMVLICFSDNAISLSFTYWILNLLWRNAFGMRSINFVPLMKRRALFWNFCSLSIWHFLLLTDGSGAYSKVGLIMLLYSVKFTSSGALENLCIDLYAAFAFFSSALIWWFPLSLWSVLYPRMLVLVLVGIGTGLLLSIIATGGYLWIVVCLVLVIESWDLRGLVLMSHFFSHFVTRLVS